MNFANKALAAQAFFRQPIPTTWTPKLPDNAAPGRTSQSIMNLVHDKKFRLKQWDVAKERRTRANDQGAEDYIEDALKILESSGPCEAYYVPPQGAWYPGISEASVSDLYSIHVLNPMREIVNDILRMQKSRYLLAHCSQRSIHSRRQIELEECAPLRPDYMWFAISEEHAKILDAPYTWDDYDAKVVEAHLVVMEGKRPGLLHGKKWGKTRDDLEGRTMNVGAFCENQSVDREVRNGFTQVFGYQQGTLATHAFIWDWKEAIACRFDKGDPTGVEIQTDEEFSAAHAMEVRGGDQQEDGPPVMEPLTGKHQMFYTLLQALWMAPGRGGRPILTLAASD